MKNYGTGVSGYLDPEGRNWETVVFESGKPVLDRELNLNQDIQEQAALLGAKLRWPSGWVTSSFLEETSTPSVFVSGSAGNVVTLANNLLAVVAGAVVAVENTNVWGQNTLTLPNPPTGTGARRTDIIVLEVWRKLLSASPDADGKSQTGLIWNGGNVKIDAGSDPTHNYEDDILDVNVGSESTKRVQIQYRLRVIPGVNVHTYPAGLTDPAVVANSVPPDAATPDGDATSFGYTLSSDDPGLYIAGDGNPANDLGTVDGYMYAIPMLGFFRRNSSGFEPYANANGGAEDPTATDRPDGLLADIVVASDVFDMRRGIAPNGWDYAEILDKNFHALLQNKLRTECVSDTAVGGGVDGHTLLAAVEIGVLPGNGSTTGDTSAGTFIGQFDAVRKTFSDRPVYETATVVIDPPGGGWVDGATFVVDPAALAVYPYTAFNWASRNDARAMFLDITAANFIGLAATKKTLNALPYLALVEGFGAPGSLGVTMGSITALGLTNEKLYLEVVVSYPSGLGVKTTWDTALPYPYMVMNPGAIPNSFPINCDQAQLITGPDGAKFLTNNITAQVPAHRELTLGYYTVDLTLDMAANTVGASTVIKMPEVVRSITSVARQVGGSGSFTPVGGATSLSSDSRTINVASGDASAPGDVWRVVYKANRPMPQNAAQLTCYGLRRGPQTVKNALLPNSLTLSAKYVSKKLYVLTAGSGSYGQSEHVPFGYVQTGGIYPTSTGSFVEADLQGDLSFAVNGFSATTGFASLPCTIEYMPNLDACTFARSPGDTDIDGRTYYRTLSGSQVRNKADAVPLSATIRHKVVLPFLAEIKTTSVLGPAGTLVLCLLTRWAREDKNNNLTFESSSTVNTTTMSVFRLNGNLLTQRVG